MNAEQRIEKLEAALGASLPVTYRAFLRSHREEPSRPVQVVSTNPDYWDVSCIFEIGDAQSYLQVDHCYELVGDVLPDGMLRVSEDQGGNLYLLDCRMGPSTGAVSGPRTLGRRSLPYGKGSGITTLPCFVGDADPLLVRVPGPTCTCTERFWLLTQGETRKTKRVRLFTEFVSRRLAAYAPLLAGLSISRD